MTKGLSEADASAVIDAVYSGFVGEDTYDADLAVDQVIALIESGIGRIRTAVLREYAGYPAADYVNYGTNSMSGSDWLKFCADVEEKGLENA